MRPGRQAPAGVQQSRVPETTPSTLAMLKTLKAIFEPPAAAKAEHRGHSERQLQLATAALLVEMTRVDYDVQGVELEAVIQAVRTAFGLQETEIEELLQLAEAERDRATSYFPFTSLINKGCDLEEKEKLIELMWRVALSDGRLDKYEEHLIRKVAGLIYVPRDRIVAARRRAERT